MLHIRFIEQVFQPERLDCLGKLNMEEGWVKPLLKLIKEGKIDGLVNVAQTIGLLGRNPEGIEPMIHMGACSLL